MKIYQQLKKSFAFAAFFLLTILCTSGQTLNIDRATYNAAPKQTIGGTTYAIFSGGVYRADANNPAILVSVSDPVKIFENLITGVGNQPAIKMYGYTTVDAQFNKIKQIYGPDGGQRAKAVYNFMPRYFKFEHNDVEGGSGLNIDHMDDTPYADSLIIRYNYFKDMSKARADGSDGGDHAQAVQFNTARNYKYAEVGFNRNDNTPNAAWVEDMFSFINSTAKNGAVTWVHDNFGRNANWIPANKKNANGVNYTGSFITLETNGFGAERGLYTENFLVENNQGLEAGNAGINFTSTVSAVARGNRIVATSTLPNGEAINYVWSGMCLFNGAGIPEDKLATSKMTGNYIMYAHPNDKNNNYPYEDRQDERSWRGNTESGMNRMPPNLNTYGPNRPVTVADLAAEEVIWKKKLDSVKVFVGATKPVIMPSADTFVSITPTTAFDSTVVVGATNKGIIELITADNKPGSYLKGSISYKSSAITIAAITKDSTNEKTFYIKGIKPGSSTITITGKTTSGKTLTGTKKVNVVATNEPIKIIVL